jgi:hypothetical protein
MVKNTYLQAPSLFSKNKVARFFHRLFGGNPGLERYNPEAKFVVSVQEGVIVNQRPEGTTERVALADLRAVIIETDDSGPFGSDVLFLLIGSNDESGCVFPQGATGEEKVLEVLMGLPGFDYKVFMEAMVCADNKRFLCWHSPDETKNCK